MPKDPDNWRGYEWTALSLTTVGAPLLLYELPQRWLQHLLGRLFESGVEIAIGAENGKRSP